MTDIKKHIEIVLGDSSVPDISASLSVLRASPASLPALVTEGLKLFDPLDEFSAVGERLTNAVVKDTQVSYPAYHNLGHIVDAVVGYMRLAKAEPNSHFSYLREDAERAKALGLLAMVGHDYLHSGGNNPAGLPMGIERNSVTALDAVLDPLTLEDKKVINDAILNTDHVPFLASTRSNYTSALIRGNRLGVTSQPVVNALVRQADLFRSTCLTPEDALESGSLLKREFEVAADSNCPHLKDLAFIATLDTAQAQAFFTKSNPCFLHSAEGERVRQQMQSNLLAFADLKIDVDI